MVRPLSGLYRAKLDILCVLILYSIQYNTEYMYALFFLILRPIPGTSWEFSYKHTL